MNHLSALAVVVLSLSASLPAGACSCVTLGGACDTSWSSGDFVFAGTVVARYGGEQPPVNGITSFTDYEFHFSAIEMLRGVPSPGKDIIVFTGNGEGDCGYPLLVGKRYLVYAGNFRGQLRTGICSQTDPEVMVTATIRELQMLRDQGRADDLFGNIGIGPRGGGFDALIEIKPLSGVLVHVRGQDGLRLSATTDEGGAYRFPSLPQGEYSVEEDVPAGLSKRQVRKLSVSTLERNRADGHCRISAFPRLDGQISGRVINAAGRGVTGFITIQPADPAEAKLARQRGGLPGDDVKGNGAFSLDELPPGNYLLVFHPTLTGRWSQQSFY